jgi:hypothetical protein
VEYYGLDSNNIPEKPYDLFFGRWVGNKHRLSAHRVNAFSKQVAVLNFCSAFKCR